MALTAAQQAQKVLDRTQKDAARTSTTLKQASDALSKAKAKTADAQSKEAALQAKYDEARIADDLAQRSATHASTHPALPQNAGETVEPADAPL